MTSPASSGGHGVRVRTVVCILDIWTVWRRSQCKAPKCVYVLRVTWLQGYIAEERKNGERRTENGATTKAEFLDAEIGKESEMRRREIRNPPAHRRKNWGSGKPRRFIALATDGHIWVCGTHHKCHTSVSPHYWHLITLLAVTTRPQCRAHCEFNILEWWRGCTVPESN